MNVPKERVEQLCEHVGALCTKALVNEQSVILLFVRDRTLKLVAQNELIYRIDLHEFEKGEDEYKTIDGRKFTSRKAGANVCRPIDDKCWSVKSQGLSKANFPHGWIDTHERSPMSRADALAIAERMAIDANAAKERRHIWVERTHGAAAYRRPGKRIWECRCVEETETRD